MKLIQDMPHRWLGTISVLERFILLWDTLRKHYWDAEKILFPIDTERTTLIECSFLMKPVGDIIVLAQATSYPSGIDAFLAMCRLRKYVFCPTSSLGLYDPSQPGYSSGNGPSVHRSPMQLQTLTTGTRSMFRESFETRFFRGYHGTRRSNTLELQVCLHQYFKKLRCLECLMIPSEAERCRSGIYKKILDMMIAVGKARQEEAGIVPTQLQTPEKLESHATVHALNVPNNLLVDA